MKKREEVREKKLKYTKKYKYEWNEEEMTLKAS